MFYVYDGTFEGFLSAVTVVMRSERNVSVDQEKAVFFGIVRDTGEPLLLDCRTVDVIPGILSDFGGYIQHHFGALMNKTIYHAFLSEVDGIETAIVDYIFLARRCRIDPIDQLYHDCVKKVADAAKTVTREAHHYLGLLRFRKLKAPSHSFGLCPSATEGIPIRFDDDERSASTVLLKNPLEMDVSSLGGSLIKYSSSVQPEIFVAECEPVTCSLPLIAEHFAERLPNQLFIIVDRRRKICVIHTQGDDWTIAPYDSSAGMDESFDSSFESLWQTYFKVLAIPERINPKLQRGNMPKRYWKYLIEHPGK